MSAVKRDSCTLSHESVDAVAVGKTQRALEQCFGKNYWVRIQMPLVLDPNSEPEPDLAVVTGQPSDYRERHPDTALLVVEVADTSLGGQHIMPLAQPSISIRVSDLMP